VGQLRRANGSQVAKISAFQIMMASHLGDEVSQGRDNRTNPMLTFLIQSSIFIAGFALGYGVFAWRSHRRGTQYSTYASRNAHSHMSTFGHARRAF